jgi:hypothetical protein
MSKVSVTSIHSYDIAGVPTLSLQAQTHQEAPNTPKFSCSCPAGDGGVEEEEKKKFPSRDLASSLYFRSK